MLGWFKKKFGKQPDAPESVEPEEGVRESAGEENAPVVEEETAAPAVAAPEGGESKAAPAASVEAATPVEAGAEDEPEPLEPAAEASPVPEPEVPVAPEPAVPAAQVEESGENGAASALPEPGEGVSVAPPVAPEAGTTVAEPETDMAASEPEDEAAVAEPEDAAAAAEPEDIEPESAVERAAVRTQEKPAAKSLFQRLQERLGKTRDSLVYRLDRLFLGKKEIDQDLFEQLEEILIIADLGVSTTMELLEVARKRIKRDQLSDPQALKAIIRDQILAYIEASEAPAELVLPAEGPFVIMVVGVNGVGKTTTIGKLAAKFVRAGQSVLLVAGDTFRAAAIDQLKIWAERVGVEAVAQNPGADPSSVVFDGLTHGVAQGHDVIIIDTAGRLHTSVNLMEELKKIKRVIGKKMPGAPHEIMLVLDATTGQNGISQAKLFHQAVGVSGLTLTKLDGTAKGGIVANVCRELRIPVRFIGIGEQIDDLRDFDAREFVEALFAGQAE